MKILFLLASASCAFVAASIVAEWAIFAPSGQVLARASTRGDELVVAECDLDWCRQYTGTLFDFERYRRPEVYTRLTAQRGAVPPA